MSTAPRQLPEGTVTMVFTDIVGSTTLLSELGERYAAVLSQHRRSMREIVARHGGFEVDTQGDAFFVVFRRASDAIRAAWEATSELESAAPVTVRVGIHTGEPARSEEGYVGIDVHVAARIAASGSGGQILMSRQTRELVPSEPVRDLGIHRLKDVGEVQLFQAGDGDFPPVRSIGRSNVVPLQDQPVGRDRELAELRSLVEVGGARLVTLTGVGGIGKTTVARALAAGMRERFPDGVWFADLSAVRTADLVESAVAELIGSRAGVTEQLRGSTALLVLDNFEQVLDAAPMVGGWLEQCPRLVIVVTSRESLRLSSEREYPLAPLEEAMAVALFTARARSSLPQFRADEAELRTLCRRLDGIPLALELAAARVKLLTPAQLLVRLDERFSLLTGGARDLPERQRTLEATVSWSHGLLTAAEQALFASLAVFAGGWTLDAAEEVVAADLDLMQSLVSKNLVRFEDGRFGMLETIREYAAARLSERPDAADRHRDHVRYFTALTAQAEPELTGRQQDAWLERLAGEEDNLRGALAWCVSDPQSHEAGLALAADLVLFWYLRSRPQEGWRWLEPLLASTSPGDSAVRARALWGAGFFLTVTTDERAGDYLTQALEMARRIGDGSMVARSLDVLGLLAFFGNDLERARSLLEESVDRARVVGDLWCLADALGTVGSIYPLVGEFDRGREAGDEGLALARSRGDLQGARMSLFALALTARRAGDAGAARASGEEGVEISRRLGDAFFTSYFLWILAAIERGEGELVCAREQAREALTLAREVGVPLLAVCALEVSAAVARDEGDASGARSYLIEAERIGLGGSVPGSYVSEVLRALGRLDGEEGDFQAAKRRLHEALELARAVSDPWAEGRAARDLEWLATVVDGEGGEQRPDTMG